MFLRHRNTQSIISKYPGRHCWGMLLFALILASGTGCEHSAKPDRSSEVAVKGLYAAALSRHADYAVIGSITHGGSFWRVADMERLYNWNHKSGSTTNIIAAAISPEGHYAFTADHQTMVLWDTRSGQALTYWTAPNEVLAVALTPNAQYAVLGLADHSVVVYDVKHGGIKRTFYHKNRVRSVALSQDGRYAASGSEDQTVKLWNLVEGRLLQDWHHDNEVRLVALSDSAERVFSVSKYDKAALWDSRSGSLLGELDLGHSALKRGVTFTSARFSHDAQLLLTGSSDRIVQLWDSNSMALLKTWTLPKRDAWKPTGAAVLAVAFADQQGVFYAISSNGFIHQLSR